MISGAVNLLTAGGVGYLGLKTYDHFIRPRLADQATFFRREVTPWPLRPLLGKVTTYRATDSEGKDKFLRYGSAADGSLIFDFGNSSPDMKKRHLEEKLDKELKEIQEMKSLFPKTPPQETNPASPPSSVEQLRKLMRELDVSNESEKLKQFPSSPSFDEEQKKRSKEATLDTRNNPAPAA